MKLLLILLFGLQSLTCAAQTGIAVPELAHCDESIQQFMRRWQLLGASVALSKDGRLVYDRAFGYANLARTAPLQPYHLLRVASISKPVTALAIMKLVEAGQIVLSHKVFGPDGYLNSPAYTQELRDPRLYDITVQHLLEHTAGWDRSMGCEGYEGCDPINFPAHVARVMHAANPVGDSTLLRFMLREGLRFAPGTHFAYSNVGYLALGKVLEAVTHQRYEAWVREHLLLPSGIAEAHLGRNLPTDRLERESNYLSRYRMRSCYNGGRQVPAAYGGFQVEAMNAHGGWLFSARDLVRLLVAADGFPSRPDIVSAATLRTMTEPSAATRWYAKGWMVDGSTWWHTGELDGTASLVARTESGYTWAILLNTCNGSPQFWRELEALGWTWLAGTKTWPGHDLFAPERNATQLRTSAPDAAHTQLTWTNGSGTARLLLLKPDSPSTAFPTEGTSYPVASRLADGTLVAANGPDSTALLARLDPHRTYYVRVVEYRQDTATGNRPVYTLDGNAVRVLPPTVLTQSLFAFHRFAQRARGLGPPDNPPLPVQPPLAKAALTGHPAPEALALNLELPSGAHLRRVRRAWRASVARLIRL
ncbi:beta-lactamase family protein [Hymenobacter sp. BT664]|uniref:Beta-lactamase family protein n=1 Tax=Hymenobacter montanus TaxID=2771359 RepID=A0A927BHT4_9BACT|nr:serine hydrolase domain-containing protein [Hymenobacter montanus]MBD2770505.1 beta-lactamase family protein [Hymenobacter montanus]